GLAIEPAMREQLEAMLSRPDLVDLDEQLRDGRIGLFVVARLAQRHGIAVRLRPDGYGGAPGGRGVAPPPPAPRAPAGAARARGGGGGAGGAAGGGGRRPAAGGGAVGAGAAAGAGAGRDAGAPGALGSVGRFADTAAAAR